jgi:diguanylate cyclase (GGDEF)-like protein
MPATDANSALEQASTLHRELMTTCFEMKRGLKLKVSASIGLATAPHDGTVLHAIIGAADARMYAVKSNGRGKVRGA